MPAPILDVWISSRQGYDEMLAWQIKSYQDVLNGQEGRLWLGEHPSTITLGRSSKEGHVLASREELERQGISLVAIDRGGDVTWHGPGQLVGYPILDLRHFKMDVHWYLRMLEETLIRALSDFGVASRRAEGRTGVWIDTPDGEAKIASIGVHVSRWITRHGFAMNVCNDPLGFSLINACGLGCRQISLSNILGRTVTVELAAEAVKSRFLEVFECEEKGHLTCV
ncbi:MAG: lipoyl(octanoyl) transferase LipB [Planctomycetota bacterium]